MAASKKVTNPVLTLDHFGVEHNIPFTSISEVKVGAFPAQEGFAGQVLVITNTGKEYYFFQKLDATHKAALSNANDVATSLKASLGWTSALFMSVEKL